MASQGDPFQNFQQAIIARTMAQQSIRTNSNSTKSGANSQQSEINSITETIGSETEIVSAPPAGLSSAFASPWSWNPPDWNCFWLLLQVPGLIDEAINAKSQGARRAALDKLEAIAVKCPSFALAALLEQRLWETRTGFPERDKYLNDWAVFFREYVDCLTVNAIVREALSKSSGAGIDWASLKIALRKITSHDIEDKCLDSMFLGRAEAIRALAGRGLLRIPGQHDPGSGTSDNEKEILDGLRDAFGVTQSPVPVGRPPD